MAEPAARPESSATPITPQQQALLRSLPSMSRLLKQDEVQDWLHGLPRGYVIAALESTLDDLRRQIREQALTEPLDLDDILHRAEVELVRRSMPSLRRVINATGIVLHTGLGRAPLSGAAVEAITETAPGYCNLEYELADGRRGRRQTHLTELLTEITGAEAATVVNNNAAATLMILRCFAEGREVIVSRGQLIEIGGSFRLPDIMSASGATLCEVGTTNRTRLSDYERAVTDDTAMLFRAHPSNYRIVGFTEEVPIDRLVELARRFDLIAVDDLGSGALFDLEPFGLPDEPNARDSIAAGADLVCFSGDKLLGGPQCGIILGRQDLIDRLDTHPLARTYRVDKMTLAAMEATLRAYVDPQEAVRNVPGLAMLAASTEELATRARALSEQLQAALPEEHFFVCSDVAFAGGGAMPGREFPTVVVQWRPAGAAPTAMATVLRHAETPVVARIHEEAVCFDLRTIREDDFDAIVAAVTDAVLPDEDPDHSDPTDAPPDGTTSLPIL